MHTHIYYVWFVCMYMYIYVNKDVYLHVYVYIYIYIYIYTRNCQNFYDKELRKANKKSLEQINFMSNGKAT